jgi:uncharacterized protein YjdB
LLTSIQISPANSTIDIGQTQQFTAQGTFSDGSTKDLTNLVTWSSSNTAVATISASGLALGQSKGSSVISAAFNTADGLVTGAASVGVIVTLKSLTITPVNPSIANGTSLQLTATGIFSDGTTQDLTGSVSWTSSSNTIAAVSSGGLVTAMEVGSTTITATQAGVSATTAVTVTAAALTSITITPPDSSIAKGTREHLIATGNFSDGTIQDLTAFVTWASSDQSVAVVSNAAGSQGFVSGSEVGSATISATLAELSGATTVTVTPPVLTAIVVTPAGPAIANGTPVQLIATGAFSDATTQDLTTQVSWASSSDAMATVSSRGLVTGTGVGNATISATLPGVTGSTTVTVTPAVLTSITITPSDSMIPKGTGEQLKAIGHYSDGRTQDLTQSVSWSSSDQSLAVVSNAAGSQGFVTGTGMGGVTISATLPGVPGVTGLASVTVTDAVLISIAVSPENPQISDGGMQQLKATGTFSDLSKEDLTTQVSWISSSDNIAHVDNTINPGLVTGTGGGSTTITATLGTVSGATTVTVLETCNIGDNTTAYNAIPFGAANCPLTSESFEAQETNELGDEVGLAPGTGRILVSLNVVFASYGCSDRGHWNDGTCVTTPGATFVHPITASVYDCSGTVCPGTLLAKVTQKQTIPYRPSANANCPDPAQWFNPLNIISLGGCQYSIKVVLTFNFPTPVTLTDQVLWTVAYDTTDFGYNPIGPMPCSTNTIGPGCPYDSLNVGTETFPGAPYAGTDIDPTGYFLNSDSDGAYCDSGTNGTGFLRLDTPCRGGLTPLGEVITTK